MEIDEKHKNRELVYCCQFFVMKHQHYSKGWIGGGRCLIPGQNRECDESCDIDSGNATWSDVDKMEEKMINIDQATRVTYGNDYDMRFFGEGVLKEYREMDTKKKKGKEIGSYVIYIVQLILNYLWIQWRKEPCSQSFVTLFWFLHL